MIKNKNRLHVYIMLIIIVFMLYLYLNFRINNQEAIKNKNKIKIAFCIIGETRTNSIFSDYDDDTYIKESWDKYIFNENFNINYDYDVFISTNNNINIQKTKSYFGNKLKNIHSFEYNSDETDNNYYLKPINNKIPIFNDLINVDYKKKFNNLTNQKINEKIMIQPYRMYDVLNLIMQYKDIYYYDYVVKIRFDFLVSEHITKYIDIMENDNKIKLYNCWDMYSIGTPDIMEYYLSIINYYGKYDFTKIKHDMKIGLYNLEKYYYLNDKLKYTLEIQTFEHLYAFCYDNNLNIDETLKPMSIRYACIVREKNIKCHPNLNCFQRKENIMCHDMYNLWK